VVDYYDQAGRFYTKQQCADAWGKAFDRIREILGNDAPTISESGHDGLIGHLDAGEADGLAGNTWTPNASDYERVPWHDMASHGVFTLFAGGIGERYDSDPSHGYGTDDYLCTTVLGGRNPMCDGPCNRGTVATYYLLHDVCDRLGRASLEADEFVGDDIHRQHTTFGDRPSVGRWGGGQVWANRGATPWRVEGITLPQYGFVARAGDRSAEIVLRDGIAARMATSPGMLFVDARPPSGDPGGRGPIRTRVTGGRVDGRHVVIDVEWQVLEPLPRGEQVFVHVDHPKSGPPEAASIYAWCDLPTEKLLQPGTYQAHIISDLPDTIGAGAHDVRYGLWNPDRGGQRMIPQGDAEGTRIRGGVLTVRREGDRVAEIAYSLDPPRPSSMTLNAGGKMISFGQVSTNGAFRLLHGSSPANSGDVWWLIPLPGSNPFEVELRMDALGALGKTIARVEPVDMDGRAVEEKVEVTQAGDTCRLRLNAQAFKYRLVIGKRP
jgi:hypothetical protein